MVVQRNRTFNVQFCSVLGLVFVSLLLAISCADKGIEADYYKGRVRGLLRVRTAVPENTDEMRVVLAPDFPFEELQKLIISEAIRPVVNPDVTTQEVAYEIEAPLGEYDAVAVLWKEKAVPVQLIDLVGLYGDLARFELIKVVLTEQQPIAEAVNIGIDFTRVDRRSKIEGRITFLGNWPDNTQVVALAAYQKLGDFGSIPPLLVFVPSGVSEYTFSAGIAPGTYNYVFVGWLPIGKLNLAQDLRILGAYVDSEGFLIPVDIQSDTTITDIDIIADFANINP